VNGNINSAGTNSGNQSPQGHYQNGIHKNGPNSAYGLIGGLGSLQKLRIGNGNSPSPASESSRNSVTRVDQLKRVLSGQQSSLPGTRGAAHSDASSESMVSYDFTGSEASYNPSQQVLPPMERSVSLREPNERARSKSRDRVATGGEHWRPLTSNPVTRTELVDVPYEHSDNINAVPPVPPLPSSFVVENTAVQDHAFTEALRKGRSVRRSSKSRSGQAGPWGEDAAPTVDLESLLQSIDTEGADLKGNVAKPPY
jgi:hypothetical protein